MNQFSNFCAGWNENKSSDCEPCFPHQPNKWKKEIYSSYENYTNPTNGAAQVPESVIPAIPSETNEIECQVEPLKQDHPIACDPTYRELIVKTRKKLKKKVKCEALAPLDKSLKKDASTRKSKSNISYSVGQKVIILNVFKNLKEDHPDINVSEVVRRTSKLTGCAERTIYRFRKEEESEHGLRPARSNMGKKPTWKLKYGDNERSAIRKVIYDCKARNIIPTLNQIQQSVLAKFNIGVAKTSLRSLMREMGFEYVRKKGKEYSLIERVMENDKVKKKKLLKKELILQTS